MTSPETSLLQFANTLATTDGGPARNSFELNLALNGIDGVTARIFWFRGNTADTVLATHQGPLPRRSPMKLSASWSSLRKLARELKRSDAVIIHGYYLWWVPLVVAAASAVRVPVLLTPHGSLTTHQRTQAVTKKRVFEFAVGWFIRARVSTFVVGSDREGRELRDIVPAAEVVTCGVGTPIPPAAPEATEWNKPVRLVTIGRIAPKKRLELAIQGVAELRARGCEATFTIAGSGDQALKSSLKTLVAELGLIRDEVSFAGVVAGTGKAELLQGSDIFVLPSQDENFGIAVAEALAHGVPVVVSTDVAATDTMPDSAGVRLKDPTPGTIADAIVDILATPAAHRRQAAYRFASETYSWHEVAVRWANVANEVGARAELQSEVPGARR